MKRLFNRRKKVKPDETETPVYPLNIYTMSLCNMCIKHMKKLGVSESIAIHLSTKDGTNGIISFSTNHEYYTLKGGKWTKLREDKDFENNNGDR